MDKLDITKAVMGLARAGVKTGRIARETKVSPGTVRRAKRIIKSGNLPLITQVENGEVPLHIADDIIRAPGEPGVPPPSSPPGIDPRQVCRLPLPVLELARSGIQLENAGVSPVAIAKELGVALNLYTHARDVVLLHDRLKDFSQSDRALAEQAHAMLLEHRVFEAHRVALPLVRKVFGVKAHRAKQPRQLEAFAETVQGIIGVCNAAGQVVPPWLPPALAAQHARALRLARKELDKLIARLRKDGIQ